MTTAKHAQRNESDDRVVVSSEGVQVRKWVAEGDAPVPVVKYELASARDEEVVVRLTDQIPDHLDPDDVGFHDEYHGDRWKRPGPNAVRFETALAAGEDVTTVFGVRTNGIEDPGAFLERPSIAVAERNFEEGSSGDEDEDEGEDEPDTLSLEDPKAQSATVDATDASSTATEGSEAGSEDGVPSTDDVNLATGGEGDGVPVWDGSNPADAVDAGATAGDDTSGGEGADASGGSSAATGHSSASGGASSDGVDPTGHGGVVGSLLSELREGTVDDDTRELLARELNLQLSASSSQFVEHLQSRMKEKRGQLEGDIERLEDSIAELYGLKADSSVVSSVREEKADAEALADVQAKLESVDAKAADLEALNALRETVADVEDDAATEDELESTAADLKDRLTALDSKISTVDETAASEEGVEELARGVRELDDSTPSRASFDELRGDVEALRDELGSLEETLESRLDDQFSRVTDRVDKERRTREDGFSSLRNRMDDLSERAADAERVASVEADLERHYVTDDDIVESLESRLQTSLLARTLLVGAGALGGAGIALAASGFVPGAVLAVLALAPLAYWWRLNDQELDVSGE